MHRSIWNEKDQSSSQKNSGILTNRSSRAKQLITKCDLKKLVFSYEVSVGKSCLTLLG